MPDIQFRQEIYDVLQNLRSLDSLKDLFWHRLNYDRVNTPLTRLGWSETAHNALAEDPVLFAEGGADGDFHILYSRLASDRLLLGLERPVVSRLLQEHPYALFVFSTNDHQRWHFVNVKDAQRVADEEKAGKKPRALFRRITVGPGERLRTATERMAMLDLEQVAKGQTSFFGFSPLQIQSAHDEAFDVEKVTDMFFRAFADLYDSVVEDIERVQGLGDQAGKLAQLLLNRMLFLYFIQKKGWLNQEPQFLYSRFLAHWERNRNGSTYYTELLYPLFAALSDPGAELNGIGIPFLNGGLFEDGHGEQMQELGLARLRIANRTFKTIFDDLLEKYNFTVTEDTPLDVEVAIDPEMLGKIFERMVLQSEKDPDQDLRKLTGSYYTPRPVVHFMCQEALKEYLARELGGENAARTQKVRENVAALLALPPANQLDDHQAEELERLLSPDEAKTLRQAILDCRVCDPAVGSGAFPVGMLHEMVAAIGRLDRRIHGKQTIARRNYEYDLKKQLIETCLYGVDIQEQAVRLCELRLWLSLVVDYDIDPGKPFERAIRDVPSLPNLSYRMMRGDSLLERLFGHVVHLDQMVRDAKTKQLIESIQADKQSYFREARTEEKRRLELKILGKQADLAERLVQAKEKALAEYQPSLFGDEAMREKDRKAKTQHAAQLAELLDLEKKVRRAKEGIQGWERAKKLDRGGLEALRRSFFNAGDTPTFIWRVDYAEVFSRNEGFDIVIANPPYVRADKGDALLAVRQDILNSDFYETLWEKWDLYVPFIERGYKLLRPGGVLQFITSDAYCHAKYAERSQKWFLQNALVQRLDFVSDLKIFEAGVRNILFRYVRAAGKQNVPLRMLHQGEFGNVTTLPSMLQSQATHRIFQPDSHKKGPVARGETVPLERLCYISVGAVVNAHEKEHKGEFVLEDLVQDEPDARHPRRFVEGKDLARWAIRRVRYIEWGTRRAPAHFRRPTFPELHDAKPKLVALRISGQETRVAIDNRQVFFNHTSILFVPWFLLKGVRNRSIKKSARYSDENPPSNEELRESLEKLSSRFDPMYLLAIMNSSWARDFLRSRRRSKLDFYPDDWKPLPIPVASAEAQKAVVVKVDQILRRVEREQDISAREQELDEMISALYETGEISRAHA